MMHEVSLNTFKSGGVAHVFSQAGLPPGVLNYVPMSRESAPKLVAELIGNPLIRHINVSGNLLILYGKG